MENLDPSTAPTSQRLLVVDDEEPVLKLVKTILSRAQYDVVTCGTAEKALKLLTEEAFDCVITDAVMPAMSGFELVRAIRKEPYGDLPVLMLTRKRHRQDVKLAVDAGITDYVIKPIDEHLLLDKVELCLKRGNGKRHIFESTLHGDQSTAQLSLGCQFSTLSESYLTARLPLAVSSSIELEIKAPIFDEIGIKAPLIKLVACKEVPDAIDSKEFPFEAKFSFVGVPETDLKKIRNWLNREEIRRKK